MKIFLHGLITGLIFQLAIGPVFFFILNIALQKTIYDGLAASLGVTLADYFYIALAIFGVGKLLQKKKVKKVFGIISSVILVIFGLFIIQNIPGTASFTTLPANATSISSSFTSVFFLTISSPMTIVFWTSLFAAKAVENNYSKGEVTIFGLAAGLATLIFMGTSVILLSMFKQTVPIAIIQTLNIIVGGLLIIYGTIRLKRILQQK